MCVVFNAGPATIEFDSDGATLSEDIVTVSTCCVEISGLPAGGLGCDIIVELQTGDVGGTNDASQCVCVFVARNIE